MERRNDLDFAKGVGIVLMVLGHSYSAGNGEAIRMLFYAFHMPLFFIVSGILHRKMQSQIDVMGFCKKRIKALLIPYFFWGFADALFLTIAGRKTVSYFYGCLTSVIMLNGLSALWFLPCLFFAELIFILYLLIYQKHNALAHGVIVLLTLIGYFAETDNVFATVILRSITGASFIYMGYLLSEILCSAFKISTWVIVLAAYLFGTYANGLIDVLTRSYGEFFLFYLNGLLGTWIIVQLHHVLNRFAIRKIAGICAWFGKYSLVVVCTSLYAIEFIRIIDHKFLGSVLPGLGDFEGPFLCAAVMGAEAILIPFCRKYLWFLFGWRHPIILRHKTYLRFEEKSS